jgi:hypothetical protein
VNDVTCEGYGRKQLWALNLYKSWEFGTVGESLSASLCVLMMRNAPCQHLLAGTKETTKPVKISCFDGGEYEHIVF